MIKHLPAICLVSLYTSTFSNNHTNMSLLYKRRLLSKFLACYKQNHRMVLRLKHEEAFPLFINAQKFGDKIALYDNTGKHTFGNIFVNAQKLSNIFSQLLGRKTSERVLFLSENNVDYVVILWAIWMSGQIAVPLSSLHPKSVLEYYAKDTNSKLLVTTPEHEEIMKNLSNVAKASIYVTDKAQTRGENKVTEPTGGPPLEFYENKNALILYTSGTTGNPKGVVLSHKNLSFQTTCLLNAWKWSSEDVILHTLPLHHVHGTVNALFCPLAIGATTVMLPKFSTEEVWAYLLGINGRLDTKISVFMAVPTIYSKLIDEHKNKLENQKEHIRNYLSNVRLMVSGSAPLPVPLYEKWLEISGHNLLERYGMTEIGMCLSNEYDSDRAPGYIGVPLPGVAIRLAETEDGSYKTLLECTNNNGTIAYDRKTDEDIKGELLVKGDGVFKEYFNQPEATEKEFTTDGWFKTGDMCEYSLIKNRFRMLGRKSVDIIKSGGYKLSALQIETKLLAHPDIKECAVVGVSDDVWGERVAVIVVLREGSALELENLRSWAADKMPKYSLPTVMKIVEEIPKNAMGKINKKELVRSIFK